MERHGHVRAIQGGGTGIGFHEPRQICDYEPHIVPKLRLQLLASFRGCNDFERDENERNKRKVWRREAENRIKTLLKRKKIVAPRCFMPRTRTGFASNEVDERSEAGTNEISFTENHEIHSTASNRDIRDRDTGVFKTQETVLSDIARVKCIPDLPRNIEDLVKLWRYGSKELGFRPVRMFLTASSRRSIIKNYSDKYWNRSGQKAAFYRFKDLAEFVSEHAPITLEMSKEGKDEAWEYGINNVKKLEVFRTESVSMSALLRFVRGERKLL